jgi:hypothetical membrane protein
LFFLLKTWLDWRGKFLKTNGNHNKFSGNQALPESRSTVKQRIGAAAGIAAPILGFACILGAIASYNGFSWTNDALSDLGIIRGATGPLFNFGLFASGLLAFNFAVFGLYNYLGKSRVGKIGAAVFAAGSLTLIAIGVFNESFSPTHYVVSVAFFVLMPIAMFIITCSFLLIHKAKMAVFTVLAGLAATTPWILQFTVKYVPNVAVPEFVSGLIVSAWTIVIGCQMLKEAKAATS